MRTWLILLPLILGSGLAAEPLPDLALQPATALTRWDARHARSARGAQGVSTIECVRGGRLWAAWYAGKSPRGVESPSSYVVLATSADAGETWSETLVLQAPPFCHTYDPCLWSDPAGRLWLFWAQSAGLQDGRMGVWAMTAENPADAAPQWSPPRRLAHGVMLNKPTVLNSGDWLLCVGLWRDNTNVPNIPFTDDELKPYSRARLSHDLGDERGSNVYRSRDSGTTFERLGQVRIPGTRVDEHMLVERRDGSLWMLLRNTSGIAQAASTDGGRTWSAGGLYLKGSTHASKRFFIRRLNSGALLMVRNNAPEGGQRTHLTAFVSRDDGQTWTNGLLLDERESSYPDAVETANGTIYVIYDHQRYTLNRENRPGVGAVLMSRIREADVTAGMLREPDSRLQMEVSRLRAAPEAGVKDFAAPEVDRP